MTSFDDNLKKSSEKVQFGPRANLFDAITIKYFQLGKLKLKRKHQLEMVGFGGSG